MIKKETFIRERKAIESEDIAELEEAKVILDSTVHDDFKLTELDSLITYEKIYLNRGPKKS
jgi:hypothetical protein